MNTEPLFTPVPLRWVGPARINCGATSESIELPLATYESPLWASVQRGADIAAATGVGIHTTLVDERMTRSILLEAESAATAVGAAQLIREQFDTLQRIVTRSSRYARLIDFHHQIAGNLLFLRFELTTGDAAGHNMTTLAAEMLMEHILTAIPGLRYTSISANYCTDKKATAVNGILGRGKYVVAELLVPGDLVARRLRTTATRITELNLRKNLIGTLLAGGIRSANAHYANMLLAFYLATGQDAANIVEGSQGLTHTENRGGDLYFSCTLPNLIVGTTGNGKHLPAAETALSRLGCRATRPPGDNARRLARIAAATVLCGELSLMAAQTNPGELMRAHTRMERTDHIGKD